MTTEKAAIENKTADIHYQRPKKKVGNNKRGYFTKDNQPEGRGRPPGVASKISIKSIMAAIEDTVGKPYELQLAENYHKAILEENGKLVATYDNLFMSKIVADKIDVSVGENAESIELKQQAFMAALHAYQQDVLRTVNDVPVIELAPTVEDTVPLTVEPTVEGTAPPTVEPTIEPTVPSNIPPGWAT